MGRRARDWAGLLCAVAVTALVSAAPTAAHEKRKEGEHVFVVGWLQEPTFVGFPNGVSFTVSHGEEPAEGEFQVEVIFGDETSDQLMQAVSLDPVAGRPGEYQAPVIPTRPGTYTFHIFGTLEDGDEIDETFTSGQGTFDEAQDPAALQFPAQDPTAGELAERLVRVDARLASLQRSLDDATAANNSGRSDRILSVIAVVLGALALIGLVVLRPRRGDFQGAHGQVPSARR